MTPVIKLGKICLLQPINTNYQNISIKQRPTTRSTDKVFYKGLYKPSPFRRVYRCKEIKITVNAFLGRYGPSTGTKKRLALVERLWLGDSIVSPFTGLLICLQTLPVNIGLVNRYKKKTPQNISHYCRKILALTGVVYCRVGLFLLDDTHRVDVCAFYLNMCIQNIIQWVLFSRALTC